MGTARNRHGMARYGLVARKVFGVSVAEIRRLAARLGRDHTLALALWETGWYEARLLAAFVDEPARVTASQMDRWSRDFENWGDCDTAVMHLFDRTPHAWGKVGIWCGRKREFVKRAGFALIASLALHDRTAPDSRFEAALALVEREACDERNFVKKAVNWALRSVGCRNGALHARAVAVATRLAAAPEATPRWIGKDALRQLATPATHRRLARAAARADRSRRKDRSSRADRS
ncbi:MAG: DNA alkylation repair protein [Gemmatimonadetes bacterium]|nr:DNA alkylation repair protein [Gemmatimonadota bacterium]